MSRSNIHLYRYIIQSYCPSPSIVDRRRSPHPPISQHKLNNHFKLSGFYFLFQYCSNDHYTDYILYYYTLILCGSCDVGGGFVVYTIIIILYSYFSSIYLFFKNVFFLSLKSTFNYNYITIMSSFGLSRMFQLALPSRVIMMIHKKRSTSIVLPQCIEYNKNKS